MVEERLAHTFAHAGNVTWADSSLEGPKMLMFQNDKTAVEVFMLYQSMNVRHGPILLWNAGKVTCADSSLEDEGIGEVEARNFYASKYICNLRSIFVSINR